MSFIQVKNLTYTYGIGTALEKTAVENFNVEIEKGQIIGIIGHTGSGKSTFVQMLNGLIKPTSGDIIIDGVNIWDKPKEIRKVCFKVGMVFQYPEYQLFDETVYKDVAFGPRNMGKSEEEIKEAVLRASKFVDLKQDLMEKSPFELSGGEKRRAAIAGVIAMDPEVLILDEPTAGLDPKGKDLLLSQIRQYQKQRKNTVILVTHSMEDVAEIADKILVINKSHIEMFDTPKNVFSRVEDLERMGLRVPQVTKIVTILKEKGYDLPDGILTVDQAFIEITNLLKREGKI